jgi:hypothetical protein
VRVQTHLDEQALDGRRIVLDLVIAPRRLGAAFRRRVLEPRQRRLAGQGRACLAARRQLAEHRRHDGIVPEPVVINEVLVAEREAEHALADQRADRVLDQLLRTMIAEAGGEPADQPNGPVGLRQQQRTGVRRDPTAAEVGHHLAALDPSEIERILDTLCRHRGSPPLSRKSFSQNNFR